jgi:type VI secretion system protein ImpC
MSDINETNDATSQNKTENQSSDTPKMETTVKDFTLQINKVLTKANFLNDTRLNVFTEMLQAFFESVEISQSTEVFGLILNRVELLKKEINFSVNQIIHHKEFLQLNSRWSSIYKFIVENDIGRELKVRLLNIKSTDLYKNLSQVMEFDQSTFFKEVYEEEYGTFGGEPFSCLIYDYYFSRNIKQFDFLTKLSQIGAAAHVPIITSCNPDLFDMTSFADLNKPHDLSKIFDSEELISFNSLRASEEAKYIALTIPRVLGALPYHPVKNPAEGLEFFDEDLSKETFLWHNAAFSMGSNIAKAFIKYGWTSSIRGVENGGKVEGLPIHIFKDVSGEMAIQCPTEISITDRREKELNDLGFLPLCYCKNKDYAVFFGGQTLYKAKIYNKSDATANACLSGRLPYILNVCRFAHYIKSIMRDKIGQYFTRDETESFLNNWISDYVILNPSMSSDVRSRYPLRGANVKVFNKPDNPGSFYAIIQIQPHGQLEGTNVSLRLVAEIPTKAA